MIFEGFATGERSLTFESGFFFALGASFLAAASTRLRFAINGSPCAIGQRCSGITESALVTSSTSPPSTMPRRSLSKRQSFTFFSERRVVHFAAESGEAPGGALSVGAEADVAGERVRVAEDALERVGLVDAVRAGHGVQQIHRLGAEVDRIGEIALEAELPQRVGRDPPVRDLLPLDRVVAQDETRRIDLRAGRADPQLHRLEVAHLGARIAGAALLHRIDQSSSAACAFPTAQAPMP